jgi:hypothetical protein
LTAPESTTMSGARACDQVVDTVIVDVAHGNAHRSPRPPETA